jgi:hypothetical protein
MRGLYRLKTRVDIHLMHHVSFLSLPVDKNYLYIANKLNATFDATFDVWFDLLILMDRFTIVICEGGNILNMNRLVPILIAMILIPLNSFSSSTYAQNENNATSSPVRLLPPSLGVKVASPISDEQVSLENSNLRVVGTSTDNINTDCQVSIILNDIKPYQNVLPTGPGGKGDYSLWGFLLTSDYNSTVKEGPNKLTAKLTCSNPNSAASDLATHYSVFFRGSSSMPANASISSSSSTNQLLSSESTPTIPATIEDANSTSISTLSSFSSNNSDNSNNSRATRTPIPAPINASIIPRPLSIKITSHTQNQTVPADRPLEISGISSDNVNSNCTVYTDWNDQKPLQRVNATGPNGANDYSNWTFTYTNSYHTVAEGANELTSKLDCGSGHVKYYTVNVTGIKDQEQQLAGPLANENDAVLSDNIPNSSVPPFQPANPIIEGNDNSDDTKGSTVGNFDNDEVVEEDQDTEENIDGNTDLFEENNEPESTDDEIGDLFE